MKLAILLHIPVLLVLCNATFASQPPGRAKPAPCISLMDSSSWKLTKAYRSLPKWSFRDSILEGSDGWIACTMVLADFVLEGDFLYNGESEGGVLVRGDAEAWLPWLHGYKMDIDADMPGTGHIHFPYRPQPSPGLVQFPNKAWQHFSIRALGQEFSVKLGGKEVIKFRDDHYRFGCICLEGQKGGIRYRNLRVQKLDKAAGAGPRSPYHELFDSAAPQGWKTEGSVSFANGAIEMDGSAKPASVVFGQVSGGGAVELDVWCKRPVGSSAPYRIAFLPAHAGACFACRNNRVASCEPCQCTSQFPMFSETTCPEYWRFELIAGKIDAYRFGERVLSCVDSVPKNAELRVEADSCVLLVRGARIKPGSGQRAGAR